MADPITPAAEPVTEKPAGTRDDWDGVASEGRTLLSSDASPEQIAKTLGAALERKPPKAPVVAEAEPSSPDERPKGKSVEARIAQARFDQRESDRRERAATERAADLERRLAAASAAPPPAAPPPAVATPAVVPDTFPNWEAWSAEGAQAHA